MPDIALGDVFRGIVPFLAAHFVLLALLMLLPALALWLPSKLY
jgi:TRAP-type C4-dicarboxylate transport system permease large subunit